MLDGANGSEVGTVRDGMVIDYESLGLAIPQIVLAKWQSIVDTLADLTEVAASCIMRLDGNRLRAVVANNRKHHSFDFSSIDSTSDVRSFCEAVATEQRSLLVINALHDARWKTNPEVENGFISYLGIPILWPNQTTFGTICVKDRKENAYWMGCLINWSVNASDSMASVFGVMFAVRRSRINPGRSSAWWGPCRTSQNKKRRSRRYERANLVGSSR